MSAKNFFNTEDKNDIVNAVKQAETFSSGEIRVHLEDYCKEDVMDRASHLFKKLDMHKTELRNGVLFYFAIKNKKFAVIGDVGINKLVDEDFWSHIRDVIIKEFKDSNYKNGLVTGILEVGVQLKKYFPYDKDTDINELPDEISY